MVVVMGESFTGVMESSQWGGADASLVCQDKYKYVPSLRLIDDFLFFYHSCITLDTLDLPLETALQPDDIECDARLSPSCLDCMQLLIDSSFFGAAHVIFRVTSMYADQLPPLHIARGRRLVQKPGPELPTVLSCVVYQ